MRLAYQELSEQQKKKEEQFRTLDPKRAEQVERLGETSFQWRLVAAEPGSKAELIFNRIRRTSREPILFQAWVSPAVRESHILPCQT